MRMHYEIPLMENVVCVDHTADCNDAVDSLA